MPFQLRSARLAIAVRAVCSGVSFSKKRDSTAATMSRDNHIPILVFDINDPKNLVRAVQGENIGTLIAEE